MEHYAENAIRTRATLLKIKKTVLATKLFLKTLLIWGGCEKNGTGQESWNKKRTYDSHFLDWKTYQWNSPVLSWCVSGIAFIKEFFLCNISKEAIVPYCRQKVVCVTVIRTRDHALGYCNMMFNKLLAQKKNDDCNFYEIIKINKPLKNKIACFKFLKYE